MKKSLGALLLLAAISGAAQRPEKSPSLSFTLDFPGSEPSHYVISVSADGKASYESNGKLMAESEPDSNFRLDFMASSETRNRLFDLVKKAKYLQGAIDSRKQGLASTGVKTLAYADGARNATATYNYSPVNAVQQLTDIFQSMSSTLECGRRLQYFHRYQKLALDEELKRMDEQSAHGQLAELSAIAPVLKGIADDPSVIKVVRSRAQRLLATGAIP